jgi:hypothetical protein
MTLLSRIFPSRFDNDYQGAGLAIWLFVPIVVLRLVMGFNSVFFTRAVATGPDGIPLDRYTPAGAEAVLSLFSLLGLWLLLLALIGVVALIRYRSMIPFLYLVLLIQQLAARALGLAHPIAKAAAPSASAGFGLTLGILALTVVGLVLSLLHRPPVRSATQGARP